MYANGWKYIICIRPYLFAGLATGIGSLLAFFTKRTNTKFLSIALGFSAGVMIYVSLVEIFVKAKDALVLELGLTNGYWVTIAGFFGGMLLIALIDRLIPAIGNPHEVKSVEDVNAGPTNDEYAKLKKMGMFTALAIAIHNFPEGLQRLLPHCKTLRLVSLLPSRLQSTTFRKGLLLRSQFILRQVIGNKLSNYLFFRDWQNRLVRLWHFSF